MALLWRRPRVCFSSAVHLFRTVVTGRAANNKLRVLFFGSDNFSVESLRELVANLSGQRPQRFIDHIEVVCLPQQQSAQKYAAPLPVKSFSQANHLHIHEAPVLNDSKSWSEWCEDKNGFDVGVVVSFGRLLPTNLLRHFPYGMVNVHPSLLPRYRGAAPLQHTILNGDTETGVAIMELSENKFDEGKILKLVPYTIPNPDTVTTAELLAALGTRGAQALLDVLQSLSEHRATAVTQGTIDRKASKAPKITRQSGLVDLAAKTAMDVDRMFRAFGEQEGLYVRLGTKQIRLTEISGYAGQAPSEVAARANDVWAATYHPPSKTIYIR